MSNPFNGIESVKLFHVQLVPEHGIHLMELKDSISITLTNSLIYYVNPFNGIERQRC